MRMVNWWGKRLLSLFLVLALVLGAGNFAAWDTMAAQTAQPADPAGSRSPGQAAKAEPAVITLYTLGGTISAAVQGEEPDSRAWTQTGPGVYQRVLNSYQRLPNPIAPCYSDQVKFAGWYDSMDYTNRVEDVFVESGSMTLYAKWIYLDITGQNGNMWYQYGCGTDKSVVDVRGLDANNNKIMTTYRNFGYGYYCKIGQPAQSTEQTAAVKLSLPAETGRSIFHKVNNAYHIYIASLVTLDGTYATMHYVVANTGNEDVSNFSLGYAADIMIGQDDFAIASRQQDQQNNSTYIQMKEAGAEGKVFRLYVKGASYGITDVDRLWLGLYDNNTYMQHIFGQNTAATTGGDSAFCCSWVNRTIPANSASVWSVKLGVGELSEMGDSSNTVILDANGGVFRDGSEISIHSGNSIPIGSLETPTRIGYEFDGWYLEREGGTRQTGIITQSITLYAHWKEAVYDLINDTVVQSEDNTTIPKETADITLHYGDTAIGRGESAQDVIRQGQELSLSLEVTEGYYLPKSIFVDIESVEGTVHLTEGTGYQYHLNSDRTTAEITVLPEYLTGDVIVTTIGHPLPAERPQTVKALTEDGGERVEICLGDMPPVLHAVVTPEELPDHTYHYQWYENSEPSNQNGGKIPGAEGVSYTFPSGRSLGDYYFYCVVTSERDNGQKAVLTSNVVTVHVKKAVRTVTLEDKEEIVTGEPVSIGEATVTPDVSDRSLISYVYYTDEACTRQTTTAAPENGGSGAVTEGGPPAAVGRYYVKAYVPEDDMYEAAENTPPARLIIKPGEYRVEILVRLDDEEWEDHGRTFALVGTDGTRVTDLERVLPGTYRIYDITESGQEEDAETGAAGTDTGVRVVVDDRDVQAIINYYTAVFYNEGVPYGEETPQKPQIVLAGQPVREPEDPVPLPGYAFEGWMTEPDGETAYDFTAPVARKTDIYAKWSLVELSYHVEHYKQNREGGYTLADTEELHGTVGEEKTAEPKEYEGYQEDEQNENRILSGTVAADNSLVLKLYYNAIEYEIHYELDGGRLPEGKTNPAVYTVISDTITLNNPEKEGYAFTGWTAPGGIIPQKEVTIPTGSTGDRSFTANWEILDLPYHVEHYLQNPDGSYTLRDTEALEGTFGKEKTAEPKEYEGYREDEQNENRIVSGIVRADGSLVLKLYYNLIEYRISYELNGGRLPEGKTNPAVYTIVSEDITLNNPEKEGYDFTGWTEKTLNAAQKEVTIPTGSTGDRSFMANWEILELPYRVEHYLQTSDGSYELRDTDSLTGTFGEERTAEPKEYEGYREDEQNENRIVSGTVRADGSLVLKLYYNLIEYQIRYELNGGRLPEGKTNPAVYTIVSDEITLHNPEKEGYDFTGWTEETRNAAQKEVTIPTGSTGDRSFTANWEILDLPYRVEHYLQTRNGSYELRDTDSLTGTFGEERTAEPKEYEGYREDRQNENRIVSGTVRADGSLVLKLYYNLIEYQIRYELNGGRLPEGKTNPAVYTIVSEDITLNNPEKEGYGFAGWTEETRNAAQKKVTIPTGSTGDRSFTANWEILELPYRVEHYLQNAAGGYILRETEHLKGWFGEEKTAEAKEYTGYREDEQNPGRIAEGVISADGALVLKLYYALEVYSLGYQLEGGRLPGTRLNPAFYTVQSRAITLINPIREGYIFTGWTEQESNTPMQTVTIPTGSTGSHIFTANWEPRTDTPYWVEHYQENPSGDGYSLADREQFAGTTGAEAVAQAKEYEGYTENTGHIGRLESGIISARTPLVLRLYYDRETYVITFVVDTSRADVHGKLVQTLRHGQAIAKPFVMPKSGYVLSEQYDGWDREVPDNAWGTATYTAQISIGGIALAEAERDITGTDTDTSDPKNSRFYPLMLRAYGQNKSIRLKWHKIRNADGYILYGSKCGTDMKRIRIIKNGKTTSCTMKNLKEGTYYKYLIVAYQNVEGRKRIMLSSKSAHAVTDGGKYGNPSKIACKPSAVNLKVGKTKTLKPSYQETKKIRTHIAKFRFHSEQPKVASVTKKGKVKAKSAGSCNIYVYAQNGFYQKIKVKVTE